MSLERIRETRENLAEIRETFAVAIADFRRCANESRASLERSNFDGLIDAGRNVCLAARDVESELTSERYNFPSSLTDDVEDQIVVELCEATLKLASAHDHAIAAPATPEREAALRKIHEFRQSVARRYESLRDFIACRGRTFAESRR